MYLISRHSEYQWSEPKHWTQRVKYFRSILKNWYNGHHMEMMGISCLEGAVLTDKGEHYTSLWTSQTDNESKWKNIWEVETRHYVTLESTLLTTKSCGIDLSDAFRMNILYWHRENKIRVRRETFRHFGHTILLNPNCATQNSSCYFFSEYKSNVYLLLIIWKLEKSVRK